MLSIASEKRARVAVRLEMMRRGASEDQVRLADETLARLDAEADPALARAALGDWARLVAVAGEVPDRLRASLARKVEARARARWLAQRRGQVSARV